MNQNYTFAIAELNCKLVGERLGTSYLAGPVCCGFAAYNYKLHHSTPNLPLV
jgi:hypothetical protein